MEKRISDISRRWRLTIWVQVLLEENLDFSVESVPSVV